MEPKRQFLIAAIVLILGVGLSFAGSKFLFDYTHDQKNLWIERHAESKAEELQFRINTSHGMLTTVAAFIHSNLELDSAHFKKFMHLINQNGQGAIIVAWVPKITIDQRMEFEKHLPISSTGTRRISEINNHGLITMAPVRNVYFPIQFIESGYANELFVGLNIDSLSKTKPYIKRAIERAGLVTTGRVRMQGQLSGRLLYQGLVPVFKEKKEEDAPLDLNNSLEGIILAVFDIAKLLSTAYSEEQTLNLTILDTDAEVKNQFIYSNQNKTDTNRIKNLADLSFYAKPYWTRYFNVGDQKWLAVYTQKRSQVNLINDWLPYAALIIGILLTTLMSIYLFLAHWRSWQLQFLKGELRGVQDRLSGEQQVVSAQTALRERLQIDNEEKTRFLHAVGHDLRQPLNSLGLYLQQLSPDKNQFDAELLGKINLSFTSLSRMLEILLDMARLEAGVIKPVKEEITLLPIIEIIYKEFEQAAKNKKIDFRIKCQDSIVYSDPVLLERVIRNLISNAISYTENGNLLIASRKQGKNTVIYIMDTGEGVKKEYIETIFDPYNRGEKQKGSEGLGLGLSIVKQTTELLGHKIQCRSEINKGTCFKIIVANAKNQGTMKNIEAASTDNHADVKKILLIDDDIDSLQAMQNLLSGWGYEIFVCENTEEAKRVFENKQVIDIFLADYHLPEETGLELVLWARKMLAKAVPAIIVTGSEDNAIRGKVEKANCLFLSKPIMAVKLKSLLNYCEKQIETQNYN